jgi:hypothetical protein
VIPVAFSSRDDPAAVIAWLPVTRCRSGAFDCMTAAPADFVIFAFRDFMNLRSFVVQTPLVYALKSGGAHLAEPGISSQVLAVLRRPAGGQKKRAG